MQRLYDRVGLGLFALYLVCYAGFVLIAAFRDDWMLATPLPGVNLAIVYGLGLIALAFVLAMIYGLCRPARPTTPPPRSEERSR